MLNKFLYWSPRVLSILFIMFLSLFALDVFDSGYQGWEMVTALFMHLLLPIVLLLVLIISWKRDLVGAIAFFAFAIFYVYMVGLDRHWSWYVAISGPAVITGILFLLSRLRKRKI
ncbi:MAG: hypothetical protein WCW87_00135 [Candidatus Paceibacterota bacterium]